MEKSAMSNMRGKANFKGKVEMQYSFNSFASQLSTLKTRVERRKFLNFAIAHPIIFYFYYYCYCLKDIPWYTTRLGDQLN